MISSTCCALRRVQSFKGTSIVYVLALGELFYTVSVIYGRTQRVLPMLVVAAIWYVVLTTVVTVIQYYVERYFSRGYGQGGKARNRLRDIGVEHSGRIVVQPADSGGAS